MLWIDWMVVAAYAVATVAIGFVFARSSAKGLKSYFLGDNTLPWWALAASGAASNFDIAGTMWLVSMVGLFGMRSFWAFAGFAIFNVAFLMTYMAPWIRRTRVMTAAELMKVRFGDGVDGRTARVASAIGMVVFTAFCLGYSAAGIGKFTAAFVPWDLGAHTSFICATVVMSLTTLYVLIGGFKSVIVTDVLQAVLMRLCGLVVGIATMVIIDPTALHQAGFITNLLPVWKWDGLPQGYADSGFSAFGAMCILFMLNGLLHSTGGAGGTYGEQRFLATRTSADAARAGAAWGFVILPRFFLVAGITFIVLTGMVDIPDDAEMLLPHVLTTSHLIPVGVRGLLLAALLAAFMSTFSSAINAGAGIFVRDVVQPFVPKLERRGLVSISYLATGGLLVAGLAIGYCAQSINSIWVWMQLGFMPALLVPNVLRWYWWRMNGVSYAVGMFSTALLGLVSLIWSYVFNINMPPYTYAPVLYLNSLVICVLVAWLTRPAPADVLDTFYRRVRPKGLWGPVRERVGQLPAEVGPDRSGRRIILNVVLGGILFMSLYFSVFYLVGHWFLYGGICLVAGTVSGFVLLGTWYRPLRRAEQAELADLAAAENEAPVMP